MATADDVAKNPDPSDAQAAVVLASAVDRLARAIEASNTLPIPTASPPPIPTAASPTASLHPVTTMVSRLTMPRGIRNNNPGNVRLSSVRWQGEVYPGNDKSFCQFTSMAYGVRCAATVLHNYWKLHELRTIDEYIKRWAPPSENATGAYATKVASTCSTTRFSVFPLDDANNLHELLQGIFKVENGGDYVTPNEIIAGVALLNL